MQPAGGVPPLQPAVSAIAEEAAKQLEMGLDFAP